MNDVKIYEVNDTMRLLDYQCPAEIITKEARKQMGDIISISTARKYTTTFATTMDMFTLGYIYGKRAARARRKGGAV